MSYYTLSRMVRPDADFADSEELFFRTEDVVRSFGSNSLAEAKKFSFDTWMNLFAAKKWYRYCALGGLYLKICATGNFYIELIGHNYDAYYGVKNDVLYAEEYRSAGEDIFIKVPHASSFDGISFNIVFAKGQGSLSSAAWCTDSAPKRENKMAIVTCTFKREEYIQKTIGKFTDFMERNPELEKMMHLYVIDNGRTLPNGRVNQYINIISNRNLGGAGGFGRGLREAYDGNFSHCLFMDDDVEIFPESFYRTLVLTAYFKDEYSQAFVNGPMMNLYEKTVMFENLAQFDGKVWQYGYRAYCDMKKPYNIFKGIDVDEKDFDSLFLSGGWWYFCFPLTREHEEYPLPFFIRGDDVEWGWRHHGRLHVSMNGISLWHAPFLFRLGIPQDLYYVPRNMFYVTARYQENHKASIIKVFKDTLNNLYRTYNYAGMAVFAEALEDILKGASVFEADPEAQMKRINSIAKEGVKVEPCNNLMEMEFAKDYEINPHTIKYKIKRIIYELTAKGTLLPKCLYLKTKGIAFEYSPTGLHLPNFLLKREVLVYNPIKNTREIRRFDAKKAKAYSRKIKTLIDKVEKNYDSLKAEFNESHARLTSREFWQEYTKLV